MNKNFFVTILIFTLLLVLGLQYLGLLGYSLAATGGCLAAPLWFFSFSYGISIALFWSLPLLAYRDVITVRFIILLFIFNILTFFAIFYGVLFLFPDLIN